MFYRHSLLRETFRLGDSPFRVFRVFRSSLFLVAAAGRAVPLVWFVVNPKLHFAGTAKICVHSSYANLFRLGYAGQEAMEDLRLRQK